MKKLSTGEVNKRIMKRQPLFPCVQSGSKQCRESPLQYGFSSCQLHIWSWWINYGYQSAHWKQNQLLWNPQKCLKGTGTKKHELRTWWLTTESGLGFWNSAELVLFWGTQPRPESGKWMWKIPSIQLNIPGFIWEAMRTYNFYLFIYLFAIIRSFLLGYVEFSLSNLFSK